MGEIVRNNAAADIIFDDVRDATTRAQARGGAWQDHAERRLREPLRLIDLVETRAAEAAQILAPAQAQLDAVDIDVDKSLGRIADEIWNDIGRPASDPAFSLLFPGGITYYTDASDDAQPDQMDILAELLESGLMTRLPTRDAKAYARRIRELAAKLRRAAENTHTPRARVRHLEAVRTAVARHAQLELAHLKRLYKAEGFSETEIHAVIPDRSRAGSRRKPDPSSAPPSTPAPPAGP